LQHRGASRLVIDGQTIAISGHAKSAFRISYEQIAAYMSPRGWRTALRSRPLPQQVRQLGDVGGDALGRQPLARRSDLR
jgi:hypothetical protein